MLTMSLVFEDRDTDGELKSYQRHELPLFIALPIIGLLLEEIDEPLGDLQADVEAFADRHEPVWRTYAEPFAT